MSVSDWDAEMAAWNALPPFARALAELPMDDYIRVSLDNGTTLEGYVSETDSSAILTLMPHATLRFAHGIKRVAAECYYIDVLRVTHYRKMEAPE